MKTIDNEATDDSAREYEVKSSVNQEKKNFLTITYKGKLICPKGYTNYVNYHKKCENENQKLTTASNILLALSGAFDAYETMNKKQFEAIVKSYLDSEEIN